MKHNQLKKQLGFWDSVAINVGIIIGVGIFRTPGEIAKYIDTVPWILIAWCLGGVISLVGVPCYAELSSQYPATGGTYVFLRESYGKWMGFLFGWIEFLILRAGSIAAISYVFTDYLQNFIPFPESFQKIVAVLVVFLFTCFSTYGPKLGAQIQNILSLTKIFAILSITALIFIFTKEPKLATLSVSDFSWTGFKGLAPAMIPVLWTYGGWHQSTFMSGEFKDTKKALPFSLILSIGIVAAVYLAINSAYLNLFTPAQMLQSRAIASEAVSGILGPIGITLVTAAVLTSAGGALNSTILTGGRIPFAVAQDYPKLSWVARVDPRFGTPLRSLWINSVWTALLIFWGNFEQLLFFCAFVNWLFFGLVGLSLFLLRKKTEAPFKTPGYPWVPAIFVFFSFWLCWTSVQHAPRETFFGILLLLSGVPVYFFCRTKTKNDSPQTKIKEAAAIHE